MAVKTLEIFQIYVEDRFNRKIQVLQSNNGGELISLESGKWTEETRNQHIICAPCTSRMNSYVKMVIKSIVPHAPGMP